MSSSYTESGSVSFTLTHAKHLAAKVATDLKRIQRFYGSPSDEWIAAYEAEITQFLKGGFLKIVTYGFQRNGQWIEPTLQYSAKELGTGAADDDPGRIRPNANIAGAGFTSYLTYSASWYALTGEQKATFRSGLPFQRSGAAEPTINGSLQSDRIYSAGGRSLSRSSVRSF
jgi:hypothetical protein